MLRADGVVLRCPIDVPRRGYGAAIQGGFAAARGTGTLIYSAALMLIGYHAVVFALFTKVFAISRGFLPPDSRIDRFGGRFKLERGLLVGIVVPAALGMILGASTILSSFFISILGMDKDIDL